jgi:hypothetical protein
MIYSVLYSVACMHLSNSRKIYDFPPWAERNLELSEGARVRITKRGKCYAGPIRAFLNLD